jgi:hypothetical protein
MPLNLLVFAAQVQITTLTCVVDMSHWDVPRQDKIALMQIYVPYLAFGKCLCPIGLEPMRLKLRHELKSHDIAVFMAVDMVGRLRAALSRLESMSRAKIE